MQQAADTSIAVLNVMPYSGGVTKKGVLYGSCRMDVFRPSQMAEQLGWALNAVALTFSPSRTHGWGEAR